MTASVSPPHGLPEPFSLSPDPVPDHLAGTSKRRVRPVLGFNSSELAFASC
jgi:hypothetical protein